MASDVPGWHRIEQIEFRWQPLRDFTPVASSMSVASTMEWYNARIAAWAYPPLADAPSESVRYQTLNDAMAALFWRERDADPTVGRPEATRVLVGPAKWLTPEVAAIVCHTGLPEAIGPEPGLADIGAPLPQIDPTLLSALVRDKAGDLDRLALRGPGLALLVAETLADHDIPLAVQLPERLIGGPPQSGPQGPLLWGLRRTVWPLLGLDTGKRGWSFSTYEPPFGDADTSLLPDIVFRVRPSAPWEGPPPMAVRREIRVRPYDPVEPSASSLDRDFAVLLIDAYRYLGGGRLARHLRRADHLRSVSERIDDVMAALYAVLPAHALSQPRLRYEPMARASAADAIAKAASPATAVLSGGSTDLGRHLAQDKLADTPAVIEVAVRHGGTPGTLSVEVVFSPAGEASAAVVLDVDDLLARHEQLQSAVLVSGVASRRVLPETERPIREIGQLLFTALLGSNEVSGRYRAAATVAAERGQPLRVVLRVDAPTLAALPWEAMYDEAAGAYLCRQDQLVRHVQVASIPPPLPVRPPLRILGVVSSPRGLPALDVEKEQEQLDRALARLVSQGLAEVRWAPEATWADLHSILLEGPWHVVHYIGHGDFDPAQDEGILALVADNGRAHHVAAHRVVDLLRQARPMPRMVVLNSCAGAQGSVTDLFSGTAAALVRGGVSAVAAMQYVISDPAAVAFARGFYSAIAHGRGVDEAVSSGRVAILGLGGETLEWVSPVLYLRGRDAQLFSIP